VPRELSDADEIKFGARATRLADEIVAFARDVATAGGKGRSWGLVVLIEYVEIAFSASDEAASRMPNETSARREGRVKSAYLTLLDRLQDAIRVVEEIDSGATLRAVKNARGKQR
jgi:hypothetical protein